MLKYAAVVLLMQLSTVFCLYDGDSCNAEGKPGTCRPLSQCPDMVSEIKRAGSPLPLDMRKRLQALNCGYDGDEPMICCSPSTNFGGTEFSVPNRGGNTQTDGSNNLGTDVNIEEFTRRTDTVNNGGPNDIESHPNLRLLPTNCGNIEEDKIYGGQRTNLFEMPWMVLLSYHTGRGPTFSCGGTLINEQYVLTAAHCVSHLGGSLVMDGVILGEYDVRTDPDCTRIEGEEICAPQIRNSTIEQVIPHSGYTPESWIDDIALIRLAEPADFNLDSMKPICLPMSSALQTESLVGRNGVVAGWGVTEEGLQSSVLLRVDLPIISTKDCNQMYKGARHVIDKQMCAGGVHDKDSCGGDSGGPLMYPGVVGVRGARYVQRGIVSFGPKRCGIGGYPGVYTNVAYYMDWILDHIRS